MLRHIKHTIKFTIEMARQQGLASSQQWQKMPQQMLFARCRSMAVREVFADVSRRIIERDALIGVSMTGIMHNPKLIENKNLLQMGGLMM